MTTTDPTAGVAGVRYAIAAAAGWPWCTEHLRPRYHGLNTCAAQHPDEPDPADPAWCNAHERFHEPMEWGDGCDDPRVRFTKCRECGGDVSISRDGRINSHYDDDLATCPGSGSPL